MPTPIIYGGMVPVLGNAGLFDVYKLTDGAAVYRAADRAQGQRIQRVARRRRRAHLSVQGRRGGSHKGHSVNFPANVSYRH
jgi:hypothetical protein